MGSQRGWLVVGLAVVGAGAMIFVWLGPDAIESATVSDAVATGRHDDLRRLLADGASPDEPAVNGLTPLMRAAARNDVVSIDVLVDGGAVVDLGGVEGLTALHVAARADAPEAVAELVALGASVALASDNGMTVLHHAAAAGSIGAIDVLAAVGVDIDRRSEAVVQGHGHPRDVGPSALSIAVRAGHLEAAEALIRHGADVDAPSQRGITPLLTAVFSDAEPAMVELLLASGADRSISVGCVAGCSSDAELDATGWADALDRQQLLVVLSMR